MCLSLPGGSHGEQHDGEEGLCAILSPHRDSLLLETGFLAVLVAPLGLPPNKQAPRRQARRRLPHEGLAFWLVRWLLFRLMFASGVVKLTSRCPHGGGSLVRVPPGCTAVLGLCPALTAHLSPAALTYHYETQCLPTPAAWFAHRLPVWLHKLQRGGHLPHRDRGAPSLLRSCSPPAVGLPSTPRSMGSLAIRKTSRT